VPSEGRIKVQGACPLGLLLSGGMFFVYK